VKSQDLRPGTAIMLDGQIWLVTAYEHVKPGKGPAYAQVKLKSLQSSSNVEKRFRTGEEIEEASLDRRGLEYLYTDGQGAVFMDEESYDQATIPAAILGDAMSYLKPNTHLTGLVHNDVVMTIELPASVDLVITDTSPSLKGATATNQLKEAVCETGLKIRVPPFIEIGETVKISTTTGEYLGRANG